MRDPERRKIGHKYMSLQVKVQVLVISFCLRIKIKLQLPWTLICHYQALPNMIFRENLLLVHYQTALTTFVWFASQRWGINSVIFRKRHAVGLNVDNLIEKNTSLNPGDFVLFKVLERWIKQSFKLYMCRLSYSEDDRCIGTFFNRLCQMLKNHFSEKI